MPPVQVGERTDVPCIPACTACIQRPMREPPSSRAGVRRERAASVGHQRLGPLTTHSAPCPEAGAGWASTWRALMLASRQRNSPLRSTQRVMML